MLFAKVVPFSGEGSLAYLWNLQVARGHSGISSRNLDLNCKLHDRTLD